MDTIFLALAGVILGALLYVAINRYIDSREALRDAQADHEG